ncbi:MAG TPA: sulfite exporter TauE/SafE family protein, partial [Burkholderiales bacterium]
MDLELALLLGLAFVAGLVDAVVGGGGLVQIPALFGYLPQATPATIFGSNKLASIAGTSVAALRYARSVRIRWGAALPAALSAFAFSFLGARTVALLPPQVMRPLVLVLLVVMAVFTLVR